MSRRCDTRVLREAVRGSSSSRPTVASRALSRRELRGRGLLGHPRADLSEVVPARRAQRPQDGWRWPTPQPIPPELAELTDDDRDAGTGLRRGGRRDLPAIDPPTETAVGGAQTRHSHDQRRAERRDGLYHGAVLIAAITSCTNTSTPSVMLGAGLLAKKRRGGADPPPVGETSLAPGSKVGPSTSTCGLIEPLSELGFDLVGSAADGIGTRPATGGISREIEGATCGGLLLSGNRNFEAAPPRSQDELPASPPLCGLRAPAHGRRPAREPLQESTRVTSGPPPGVNEASSARSNPTCFERATESLRGRRELERADVRRATVMHGTPSRPTSPRLLRGMPADARKARADSRRQAIAVLATASPPTNLARGRDQEDSPAGAICWSTGSSRVTSTRMLAARQP